MHATMSGFRDQRAPEAGNSNGFGYCPPLLKKRIVVDSWKMQAASVCLRQPAQNLLNLGEKLAGVSFGIDLSQM